MPGGYRAEAAEEKEQDTRYMAEEKNKLTASLDLAAIIILLNVGMKWKIHPSIFEMHNIVLTANNRNFLCYLIIYQNVMT